MRVLAVVLTVIAFFASAEDEIKQHVRILKGDSDDAVKSEAALALHDLAVDFKSRKAIARAGVIPPVIDLLTRGSNDAKQRAAQVIMALALNEDLRDDLNGAVQPLMELIRIPQPSNMARHALGALGVLVQEERNLRQVVDAGAIKLLVAWLANKLEKPIETGVVWLLSTLAEHHAEAVFNADAVAPMIEIIKTGHTSSKTSAMGVLMNLGNTNDAIRGSIADAGAVELLAHMLKEGNPLDKVTATATLWKLSRNVGVRKQIVEAGCIVPLVEALSEGGNPGGNPQNLIEQSMGVLGVLALNNEVNQRAIKAAGGVEVIESLIEDDKVPVQTRAQAKLILHALSKRVMTDEELESRKAAEAEAAEEGDKAGNRDPEAAKFAKEARSLNRDEIIPITEDAKEEL